MILNIPCGTARSNQCYSFNFATNMGQILLEMQGSFLNMGKTIRIARTFLANFDLYLHLFTYSFCQLIGILEVATDNIFVA